ncbi:MAG: hypothetical protein ACTSP3_08790 [Candidatus Heimdallarchaeaceae archaeon]
MIDDINKKRNREELDIKNYFMTESGKKFAENYFDLSYFIAMITIIPPFINSREKILKFIFSGELLKLIEKYINNGENITKEEFTKIENIIASFQELIKENKESVIEQQSTETEEITETLEQLKVTERIIAYYIFALYAYLEVYSKSLYKSVIIHIDNKKLYPIQSSKDLFSNPYDTIKVLLKNISDSNANLNLLLDRVLHRKSWITKKEALVKVIELRNEIAHNKPILQIEELRRKFKKETRDANREKNNTIKEMKKNIPEKIYSLFESLLEEFGTIFLIRNIGVSCVLFIVCVDKLISDFFTLQPTCKEGN